MRRGRTSTSRSRRPSSSAKGAGWLTSRTSTGASSQVGTQQRSGPHYQKARDLIRGGHIGTVVSVRMWSYRNILPGFGTPPDGEPPRRARLRPLARTRSTKALQPQPLALSFPLVLGLFGRSDDEPGTAFSRHRSLVPGCQRADGCHERGGRFALRDNGETPDTQDTLFEYPGWTASWSHRECCRGTKHFTGLNSAGRRGASRSLARDSSSGPISRSNPPR